MSKKEIKEILKGVGETMIAPSWFVDNGCILFNTFDNLTGNCTTYYIDTTRRYATRQNLSKIMVHNSHDVSEVFFR